MPCITRQDVAWLLFETAKCWKFTRTCDLHNPRSEQHFLHSGLPSLELSPENPCLEIKKTSTGVLDTHCRIIHFSGLVSLFQPILHSTNLTRYDWLRLVHSRLPGTSNHSQGIIRFSNQLSVMITLSFNYLKNMYPAALLPLSYYIKLWSSWLDLGKLLYYQYFHYFKSVDTLLQIFLRTFLSSASKGF